MTKGLVWDKINDHGAFMCVYDHVELATMASDKPQLWSVAGPTIGFAGIFGQLIYFLVIGWLLLFHNLSSSCNSHGRVPTRPKAGRLESRRRIDHKSQTKMRARTSNKAGFVAGGIGHACEDISENSLSCCKWWTYKDYCIIVLAGHLFYLYWHSIFFFEDENSDFAIMVRRARPP